MDERNDKEGFEARSGDDSVTEQRPSWAPQAPGTPPEGSPMPLSMPPFAARRDAFGGGLGEDPTLEEVRAVPPDPQVPGTALPGAAGGAPPAGGQPPYLPPYGYGWPPGGLPADEHPSPSSGRHRRAFAALGIVALLTGGLGAGLGVAFAGTGGSSSSTGSNGLQPLPQEHSGGSLSSTGEKLSVSAIASSVEPAVVDIRTTVVSPVGQQSAAAGTGMILTSSGEILTNNHVVENATSIRVVIEHHGTHPAKIVGVNPTKDVALLQVQGVSNLPYVSLGDSSSVAVGDSVVAVGNALGMGGPPSVVTGQVSALGRTITASDPGLRAETLHGLIQTTAPIQPGDSGGPLLSAAGKVIGMDTAAASGDTGSSVGFSIPINAARSIVVQMQHHQAVGGNILGTSPFLGVYESNVGTGTGTGAGTGTGGTSPFGGLPGFGGFGPSGSSGTAAVRGVTIAAVAGSSPAERAGLHGGDVITSIDGKATADWSALRSAVQARKPGQTITVTYVSPSGAKQTVHVQLAGLPK